MSLSIELSHMKIYWTSRKESESCDYIFYLLKLLVFPYVNQQIWSNSNNEKTK